ncbi:uncharacterized protein LOC114759026 [Neltuma alba]|uniref:uncharacterized protein LOC114753934 n=1 Tax=Neltuma alba TaxID=207710 RepID=UPI0010A4E55F|nr:uncharacterized protein LOC114753934 [Prosopis alba]XP_028803957.1 uncharacterized protein LOC114759026 [Prosopis alba]
MDSFGQSCRQTTNFRYNPNSGAISHGGDDDGAEFSGILEIYVHHARNIHNICIYENQDVYAKFSLTYNPDETLSTRIVNGGGKNPTFDENLRMEITQNDAVLKCEIWMFSRLRNYMEDQLLGFALVPISQVAGKGKVTQEYSLSSTDLFHSPAGTVKLTLCLNLGPSLQINSSVNNSVSESVNSNTNCSSISSEVVLLDRKISEVMLDPVEFSRIEFPDISVVRENQQMVSEYFNLKSHGSSSSAVSASASASRPNSGGLLPFLRLSASPQVDDYEMTVNSPDGNHGDSISPNGSIQNSGFFSSTTTTLSDDRNSADSSIEKKSHNISGGESSNSANIVIPSDANHHQNSGSSCGPDTPTSKKESDQARDEKEGKFSATKENESNNNNKDRNIEAAKFGQVFSAPLGNINLEAEQSAMQQQIVDMYMRSMQQFTESLAKMKLPMDLNTPDREDCGDVIQNHSSSNGSSKLEIDKKNDRSRVFYGSRAFF